MKIVIDGVEIGGLRPGEVIDLNLPPGSHRIRARMDWCSSPELAVVVSADKTTRVTVEYPWWHGIRHLLYKPGAAIRIGEA